MSLFIFCFVFLRLIPEKVVVDPLLILKAHNHQENKKIMVVELKEAEINLHGNLSPLNFWSEIGNELYSSCLDKRTSEG